MSYATERTPLVVFAVGNASRGDDALGPAVLDAIRDALPPGAREVCDFQLQIEHALELRGAALALFIDAAVNIDTPYRIAEITPGSGPGILSHALQPEDVLAVFARVEGEAPPPAFVLAVRGSDFELGADLSGRARADLAEATRAALDLVRQPAPAAWRVFSATRERGRTA